MLEYPPIIWNIKEIQIANKIIEPWLEKLTKDIEEVDEDILITTATERGIARREKILGITPQATDSLEDRRYRVLVKWYDTYPYTENNLRERLDALVGAGNYTLTITPTKCTCKLALARKLQYNAVGTMLEKVVPLHIVLDIQIMYNTWGKLSATKWSDESTKTWKAIKEEVI